MMAEAGATGIQLDMATKYRVSSGTVAGPVSVTRDGVE
jgi:hypothetical protein